MIEHLTLKPTALPSSSKAESVDFNRLPIELLEGSLRFLPVQSLKNARLTCKHWGAVAARCLFRRVYFAPRQGVIDVLLEITKNEAFSSNVEELVYDARLFWRRLEDPEVYTNAYSQGFPDAYPENDIEDVREEDWEYDDDIDDDEAALAAENEQETRGSSTQAKPSTLDKLVDSASRYSRRLREQNVILDDRKDLESLRTAMKRLPNLRRVSVLDWFRAPLDYQPFLWDSSEFQWYHHRSAKSCEDIARPTRWSEADFNDEGMHLGESPWDFRGITNLLTVLKEQASRLQHLSLGCQMSNLSPEIYTRKEHIEVFRHVAPKLVSLKMDCRMPFSVRTVPTSDCVKAIAEVLKEAKHLQSLSLTVDKSLDNWLGILVGTKWPYLRLLDLGDGTMDAQVFRAIANAHKDTLRELRLRNMKLLDGSSWEDVARELGRSLQLHFIYLGSMSDPVALITTDTPYLDGNRAMTTARLFMQQVPSALLCTRSSSGGSVIAWHAQEFKPTFNLNSICEA